MWRLTQFFYGMKFFFWRRKINFMTISLSTLRLSHKQLTGLAEVNAFKKLSIETDALREEIHKW